MPIIYQRGSLQQWSCGSKHTDALVKQRFWLQIPRSLEVLDLHSNLLESFNGFSALTNLRRLNLAGNRFSQLCSLSMLGCLEDLNLSRNFITSLEVQEAAPCHEDKATQVVSLPNSLRKLNLAANRCAAGCIYSKRMHVVTVNPSTYITTDLSLIQAQNQVL